MPRFARDVIAQASRRISVAEPVRNAALMTASKSPDTRRRTMTEDSDVAGCRSLCCLGAGRASMSHRSPRRPRPRCGSASRRRAPSSSCRSTSGIEVGIFKKHGLDVESSDFGGGPRVQQALTAGALDIAIGSGPELALIVKGAPEIGIAAHGGRALCGRARRAQRRAEDHRRPQGQEDQRLDQGRPDLLAGAGAVAPAGLGHRRLRPSRRSAPPRRRPPRSRPSRSTA